SLTRTRHRETLQGRQESRSFPPSVITYGSAADAAASSSDNAQDEERSFFDRPPPPPPPLPPPPSQQSQIEQGIDGMVKDDEDAGKVTDLLDAPGERETSQELMRLAVVRPERTTIDGQARRVRHMPRDHYISRSRYDASLGEVTRGQQDEGVTLRGDTVGPTRIPSNTIDRIFDNSNRRQYGMGIVGRFFG
ncbi:uncharacterized protein LOC144477520, partial [Augochlora pura]